MRNNIYAKYLKESEDIDSLGQYMNVVQIWNETKLSKLFEIDDEYFAIVEIETGSVKEGFYDEEVAFVKLKNILVEILDDNYDFFVSQNGQELFLKNIEDFITTTGKKEFRAEKTFISDENGKDKTKEFVKMIVREAKKVKKQKYISFSMELEDFYICVSDLSYLR